MWVTPFLNGKFPVIRAERVGEQVGTDLEVVEGDAARVEGIEVRGLEPRVAVAAELAVALVVGEDEDDVRAAAPERLCRHGFRGQESNAEKAEDEQSEDEGDALGGCFHE